MIPTVCRNDVRDGRINITDMIMLFISEEAAKKIDSGEIPPEDLYKHVFQIGWQTREYDEKEEIEPEKKEYVYVVKSGRWHKIGRTADIKSRMKFYKRHDKNAKLVFQMSCINSVMTEKMMIGMFPEHRVGSSEWFMLEERHVSEIIMAVKNV